MRLFSFITLLFIGSSCSTTKNTTQQSNKLYGTWLPVKQQMGILKLPKTAFEKQQLIISDSTYTVIAESVDKGVVYYSKENKMDIYGREGVNKGRHFTAIYKYENDELTICYNLRGDSYPETFETKGNRLFFLSVFKKVSTK